MQGLVIDSTAQGSRGARVQERELAMHLATNPHPTPCPRCLCLGSWPCLMRKRETPRGSAHFSSMTSWGSALPLSLNLGSPCLRPHTLPGWGRGR